MFGPTVAVKNWLFRTRPASVRVAGVRVTRAVPEIAPASVIVKPVGIPSLSRPTKASFACFALTPEALVLAVFEGVATGFDDDAAADGAAEGSDGVVPAVTTESVVREIT